MRPRSRKAWIIIGGLGAAIVFALGWALLLSPQQSDIDSINSQTSQQVAQNGQTADAISKLEKQVPQLPAAKTQLKALTVAIPKSAGIPQVLLDLSSLASLSGTTLGAVTPGAPVSAQPTAGGGKKVAGAATGLMEIPLNISVVGTYDQVQKFVMGLEKTPRAILTTSVSVDPLGSATDAAPAFTGNIGAIIYYSQDQTVAPAAGGTAKTGGSTAASPSKAATPAPTSTAEGADPALATGS